MLADDFFIADEDELIVGIEERERVESALEDFSGSLIAAHGINGDAHCEPQEGKGNPTATRGRESTG